ncbi:MAG: SDR family NAD(P)-dependent oxidoreductase [Clostridiales bacterium]|jgi:sorbitol-6-phosphate 2-dehydrogenase|nr:SDR family NAD(P)-dependent oxidoreductase [Clostridiales bacterium]
MERDISLENMNMVEVCRIAQENVKNRPQTTGRLAGKIGIVTGGAQGFGLGIAQEMVREGATVVLADLNEELAKQSATEIGARAVGMKVDVSDGASVERMIIETVYRFGGLDILVSNAGVLKAGTLEEMTQKDFEFVTKVNYTGFFLCAKYASQIMRAQYEADSTKWSDIIQINSKSGLEGSKANFAYAGGKFGGIGLVQSFALELAEWQIKVNAICPGNFYDGPLWSDPVNGLFVQYLNTGKVPGAKTLQDVKDHYLSKSPIKRGCYPEDVAKALFYCVEQEFETGQAIPVTGGQVMLS